MNITLRAVTSIPRLGWNDHWGCVQQALRPFGIPLRRFTGVFWGQCMQRALAEALDDGVDWVLTLDYDTLFTAEQVDRLLGRFGAWPDIDALAGLQPRRERDTPLMTVAGQRELQVDGDPIRVHTAHFGFTLIRMESLRDLPRPWFASQPDADGNWSEDRIDEDIWFWQRFAEHNRHVAVDPEVRVGHLELMVSDYDEHLQIRRRPVSGWRFR